jgi:chloramphenicol 3-O phosphotransferase
MVSGALPCNGQEAQLTRYPMPGHIILLNGASSAGKSTLARALQRCLPLPFWHYSIDHLLAAKVLPGDRIDSGEFPWRPTQREPFFEGFHNSIAAFAAAGNNLVVEHIVETRAWMNRLLLLLEPFDVFFVGVHCPLEELERREVLRGDRRIGEARADFQVTHGFGHYDFECTMTEAAGVVASSVVRAWSARRGPGAFRTMLQAQRDPKT